MSIISYIPSIIAVIVAVVAAIFIFKIAKTIIKVILTIIIVGAIAFALLSFFNGFGVGVQPRALMMLLYNIH